MQIPYELKRRCVELSKTDTARHIYDTAFSIEHDGMGFETFRHKLRQWKKHTMADDDTLNAGTYAGFTTHDATVQVDGAGNIRQAWIKQSTNDNDYSELCELIRENVQPITISPKSLTGASGMLELPLFDMHFGIAAIADYAELCAEIQGIIAKQRWQEINILIGQDLFHNNDMRGHTAKGTAIQRVKFPTAWADARTFWYNVIATALDNADTIHVRYSKGNHDECPAWCFTQELKARFPQIILDDVIKARKVILWQGCFIGYGHCEYTGKLSDIFQDFVLDFPTEFASAKVREIHTGHTHHETEDKGIMVRRLASAVPTDEWSEDNGYVGAHKRFQIFEYMPGRLTAVDYV